MPEREPTADTPIENPATSWEAHLAKCPACAAAAANIIRAHHQGATTGYVESAPRAADDSLRFSRGETDPPLTSAEIDELRQVVRARTSPVQLAAWYGGEAGLWEKGRWFGTCPLCQGPEGCFQAGEDGAWNCGFCKEGGDVVDLVAKAEGWTTDRATLQLAQWLDLIAQWQVPLDRKAWMQQIYERKEAREQWQAPNPKWEPPHRMSN
jgi:hypothetical protein